MDAEQAERIAQALESIARSLDKLATTGEQAISGDVFTDRYTVRDIVEAIETVTIAK